MTQLGDFILDNTWIEICDKQGRCQEATLREAHNILHQDIQTQDQKLGISRQQTPVALILIPDGLPQTDDYRKLEQGISAIAHQLTLAPETSQQAHYLRCLQMYWYVKAIRLANLIVSLIPDPVQPGEPLSDTLPKLATRNLIADTNADKALYDLLKAGKSRIIKWAKEHQLDYPFQKEGDDITDLFLHILEVRFQRDLQGSSFGIENPKPSKEERKRQFRCWLKFLNDYYGSEEPEGQEYSKVLWSMEWEGYPLLALRKTKREKPFQQLWKHYLKAQRATVCMFDTDFYWHEGIPHQTQGTRAQHPVQATSTPSGHIHWQWLNKS